MTDVANEAGLTRGALLYYYDDLNSLLVEAHAAGIQRVGDEREALVSGADGPSQKLGIAIESGLPSGPDDALMRLLYEFDVLAGTSELHDRLVRKLYRRQLAVFTEILEAGAAADSFNPVGEIPDIAMNFVALEDAYGLHIVAGNSLITVDAARRAIRLYASQAGCPAIMPRKPTG
ncbi:TetR/AcrR family transcriptional regulator [Spelaeicoccus albus]